MGVKKWHGWWIQPTHETSWVDVKWAEDQFGVSNAADRWFYSGSEQCFYFREEKDLLLFLLRWG